MRKQYGHVREGLRWNWVMDKAYRDWGEASEFCCAPQILPRFSHPNFWIKHILSVQINRTIKVEDLII